MGNCCYKKSWKEVPMQLKKLISDTKRFEWRLHRTTDPQGSVPPIVIEGSDEKITYDKLTF